MCQIFFLNLVLLLSQFVRQLRIALSKEQIVLIKVSNLTLEELEELNKTEVHNLAEERSVGSINNELKIRGKCNLECVSRNLVLNKSFDLLKRRTPTNLPNSENQLKPYLP